jgi:hypothetical protein
VPLSRPRVAGLVNSAEVLALKTQIFGLIRQEQRKSTEPRNDLPAGGGDESST